MSPSDSSAAPRTMTRGQRFGRWIGWLALVLGCLWVITHARFSTDMSAFLPKDPSAEQQLLVDQIREGALSRMLLLGIEGGTAEQRAEASIALAAFMRASPDFEGAINGDTASRDRDGAFLLAHRYVLSDRVTPERFSASGLTAALGDSLQLLASPAGSLFKPLLPRDPTAEMVHVLEGLASAGPSTHTAAGVLATADGQRALLMAMLHAPGTDTDAQQAVLTRVNQAFAPLATKGQLKLVMTGAPYFAVASRDVIKSEVERLSTIGTAPCPDGGASSVRRRRDGAGASHRRDRRDRGRRRVHSAPPRRAVLVPPARHEETCSGRALHAPRRYPEHPPVLFRRHRRGLPLRRTCRR